MRSNHTVRPPQPRVRPQRITLIGSGLGIIAIGAVALLFAAPNAHAIGTDIDLGTATSYSVLGGQTVTNTGNSVLSNSLGVSPGTSVTGFPPRHHPASRNHPPDRCKRWASAKRPHYRLQRGSRASRRRPTRQRPCWPHPHRRRVSPRRSTPTHRSTHPRRARRPRRRLHLPNRFRFSHGTRKQHPHHQRRAKLQRLLEGRRIRHHRHQHNIRWNDHGANIHQSRHGGNCRRPRARPQRLRHPQQQHLHSGRMHNLHAEHIHIAKHIKLGDSDAPDRRIILRRKHTSSHRRTGVEPTDRASYIRQWPYRHLE